MSELNNMNDKEALDNLREKHTKLIHEVSKVIIGQNQVIREVTMAVLAGGHCLLVGVPGLAKTLLVNTVSQALGLSFNRIQFTPDLMPSDITGSEILNDARKFEFIKGPLFANIVLGRDLPFKILFINKGINFSRTNQCYSSHDILTY